MIAAAVLSLRYLSRYRRLRRLIKSVNGASSRPRALAISFGGSIKMAVADYLRGSYAGTDIPVVEYAAAREVTVESVDDHLRNILAMKHDLQAQGVTELHLFFKGPVALAVLLGALLDNWVGVKIYQNGRSGQYEAWTMLHVAKELGSDERFTMELARAMEPRDG